MIVLFGVHICFFCGLHICSSVTSLLLLLSLKWSLVLVSCEINLTLHWICLLYTFRCGYKIKIFFKKLKCHFCKCIFNEVCNMLYWNKLVSSCIFNCSPKFFNVFMVSSTWLIMTIITLFCCWSLSFLEAISVTLLMCWFLLWYF